MPPPPPPAPPRSPKRPCRNPRPDGASEVQGEYAPKSLAQLVGAWAYSVEDCERLFRRRGGGWAYRQPVDKFAQAAIVKSPKRILLPSAACRVERASEAKGALKVQAECADSISYTSRSRDRAARHRTRLQPFRRSGARHNPEEMRAVRGKQGERFSCADGRQMMPKQGRSTFTRPAATCKSLIWLKRIMRTSFDPAYRRPSDRAHSEIR